MVRTKEQMHVERKCIKGGNGEALMQNILNGADEMYGKGRLFAHVVVDPGVTFGEHYHEGDNEIFYILKGHPTYNDNGNIIVANPGDTLICNSGELHGVVNNTDSPVEMIALILYN